MPQEVTRRRFVFQTLGVIGGATVAGDLLPLLADAAKRKQVLRVAVERDFESLRPDISAGYTNAMLKRLIYTTSILWGTEQRQICQWGPLERPGAQGFVCLAPGQRGVRGQSAQGQRPAERRAHRGGR